MGCKKLNLIGQRFGKLVVVAESTEKKNNNYCWVCKCDCGNTKVVAGAALKRGKYRSCGCGKGGGRKIPRKYFFQDDLYTVKEIAEITGRSTTYVRQTILKDVLTPYSKQIDCGNGRMLTFSQIARKVGISREGVRCRYKKGWRGEKLLTPPRTYDKEGQI